MKLYHFVFILILLLMILSGCSEKEENLNLLFFSDLPTTVEEDVLSVITKKIDEDKKIQLEFYPLNHEKVTIELAGRSGDIFFVPQEDVQNIIDPVAFTILTEVATGTELEGSISNQFKAEHPESGTLEVYALPVGNDSLLMKEIGFTLQKPLAAFIPGYSEEKEESMELLKYLINN